MATYDEIMEDDMKKIIAELDENWEKGFYIKSSLIETKWKQDLTNWLKNCKGITNITDDVLKKWDDLLNSGSSENDIVSFRKHTGWKYRF